MTGRVPGTLPEPGSTPDLSLADDVSVVTVRQAASRLDGVAHRTPIHTSQTLDAMAEASLYFKCENFQRMGAFKFRGAYNAISQIPDGRGVLTYSSGNHAQAVALAACLLDRDAVIVMPSDAPRVKLDATRQYLDAGAGELVLYDRTETTREELGAKIASDRGLHVVPPYDDPHVIAGQGTVALELLESVRELDVLLVPCGGGGLLSGCATVAEALSPKTLVVGVEPEAGDDVCRTFSAKHLCTVRDPETIADGARTPSLGHWTHSIVAQRVAAMMSVSDSEILGAMRLLWERMKFVVEPTGAMTTAAALKLARGEETIDVRGRNVGVVISGGNVDVSGVRW